MIFGEPNQTPPVPAYPWVLMHRGYFNELKHLEDIYGDGTYEPKR